MLKADLKGNFEQEGGARKRISKSFSLDLFFSIPRGGRGGVRVRNMVNLSLFNFPQFSSSLPSP